MQPIIQEVNEQVYQETLDYLYGFINLESKTLDRYHASKMDPDRVRRLLKTLGDPQNQFPSIHIAGTKGKGSVAAMCSAVLRASGLRVGLYTSPHLRDFRERIRILTPEDPEGMISKADLVRALEPVRSTLDEFPGVTWFEIVTAVAFNYFAEQKVDIGVIEVGLGGRLDATNSVTPLVSVITRLSLDHTSLLGDTLREIAFEKGGIIKPGIPVVIAPQDGEAEAQLVEIAARQGSPLIQIGRDWHYSGTNHHLLITRSPQDALIPADTSFDVALAGDHQLENAAVALAALDIVQRQWPLMTLTQVREGLATVRWDGRLQTVYQGENGLTFLVDSAHNQDSAATLASALIKDYDYQRLWLIFGTPADKAIPQMMRLLFPLAQGIILAEADHPRATPAAELARMANDLGYRTITPSSLSEALETAFQLAGPGDLICGTGSIIFVGDLLNQWESLQSQLIA